jgi:hypothetical protein
MHVRETFVLPAPLPPLRYLVVPHSSIESIPWSFSGPWQQKLGVAECVREWHVCMCIYVCIYAVMCSSIESIPWSFSGPWQQKLGAAEGVACMCVTGMYVYTHLYTKAYHRIQARRLGCLRLRIMRDVHTLIHTQTYHMQDTYIYIYIYIYIYYKKAYHRM